MSPAGSYESLIAAIQGGADSVYFGIEQLNMRAKSSNNFTLDDLSKIINICRENNIRSYLTLNTVLYDDDMVLMKSIVDEAKLHNISAMICSNMAAIYANSIGQEIHISTQLNVSNSESVRFYSKFADVIVTARELDINQVKEITGTIERLKLTGPSGKPLKSNYLPMGHYAWQFQENVI